MLDDKTSDDGIIQVEGLSRRPTSSAVGSYTLEVDGERIAFFNLAQNKTNNELTFKLMPRPGDLAPDLELVSIDTGKVTRLSDLTGKVVCLEVWATWCGPCQSPMTKLNELTQKKQEQGWADRVQFVSRSVDDTPTVAKTHVVQRGWTNLDHYWSRRETSDRFSEVQRTYAIDGIPHAILIDTGGRIVWRGHPTRESGSGLANMISDVLANEP